MADRVSLVFDLDDTLVDTYGLLITPLERRAADIIGAIEGVSQEPDQLFETLLDLRRKKPRELYAELSKLSHERADVIVNAHQQVFSDFSIEDLQIATEVTEMLAGLASAYALVLLTEGDREVQQAKIDHLGIAALFRTILIVDPSRGESKLETIKRYVATSGAKPERIVVIGNRLDKEIASAKALGAKAIWVKSGEGSEESERKHATADVVVSNVIEVPRALHIIFQGHETTP